VATDLTVDPNVFAAKLGAMFVAGAQLGWFSLGGASGMRFSWRCHP
jgi:hypothetical protein